MNLKVDPYRVRQFSKTTKLRTVMIVQGVLWIIAGFGLLMVSSVVLTKVILMLGLGAAFIGWGHSIKQGKTALP